MEKRSCHPSCGIVSREIWVPQITLREDHKQILDSMWDSDVELYSMSSAVLDFADKLADEVGDP